MKVHVVYDPHHDLPRILDISHANVNDAKNRPHDRDRQRRDLCLRQGLRPLQVVDRH